MPRGMAAGGRPGVNAAGRKAADGAWAMAGTPGTIADLGADEVSRVALAAIRDGVAVLDADGRLLQCNRALAELCGRPAEALAGQPLEAWSCELLPAGAVDAFRRMRATGRRESVEAELGGRWLRAMFDPIATGAGHAVAVLVLADLTPAARERQRAEAAEATAQCRAGRIEQLEGELRLLQQLAAPPGTAVTARLFGMSPLHEAAPDVFEDLVRCYGDWMDRALEQQEYKVTHNLTEGLQGLAEWLGALGAGPRDVVALHGTTLKAKSRRVPPAKAYAYVQEGRLMVLELMGHLASYYRRLAAGGRRTSPREVGQP